jgi:ArsR family transcriptional regulator, arsenate/arsenite/antimonite-responsive transcriptional repressor
MLKDGVKIFKALSDANRLRILKMLQKKSLCVCEITAVLKLSASTVSNHLSILKECDLIIEEKSGKWVNYMINSKPEKSLDSSLLSLFNYWFEDDRVIKSDRERIDTVNRRELCKKPLGKPRDLNKI